MVRPHLRDHCSSSRPPTGELQQRGSPGTGPGSAARHGYHRRGDHHPRLDGGYRRDGHQLGRVDLGLGDVAAAEQAHGKAAGFYGLW